jgi:hypothetical protein
MGSGRAATAYTWPDLLATTALWLVGLVAMTLIFTQNASPHYQRRQQREQQHRQTEPGRTLPDAAPKL